MIGRLVIDQAGRRTRPAPLPAYEGQDISFSQLRLDHDMRGQAAGTIPPVQLFDCVIENASLLVGSGIDGAVLDGDGKLVPHSATFSDMNPYRCPTPPTLPPERPGSSALFIGFDGAWRNWYHWSVFALRRIALAAKLLPNEVHLAVPSEVKQMQAWQDALDALGLGERVVSLEPGRYPVAHLHMLLTATPEPTDIVYFDELHAILPTLDVPRVRRIAVHRNDNARLDDAGQAALASVASRLAMEHVDLAKFDFQAQQAMFAGASLVVAAHGSALANLMHCRPGTRVLELNRRLDGESVTRPWFYQIAAMRGLIYMALDVDAGDVTEPRLEAAIARLLQ